ncbi:MAG: hypothetical protein HFF59_02185 [Lawsonibacter sp.]|jgi:hypothetical protein|nr:hypothetical protein [Lawsonibacter sp.]
MLGLFNIFKNTMWHFLKTASDKELKDEYEKRRQKWLKEGGGEKTYAMKVIGEELSRRAAEAWKKDPRRNTDPNFHWTDKNRWEKD